MKDKGQLTRSFMTHVKLGNVEKAFEILDGTTKTNQKDLIDLAEKEIVKGLTVYAKTFDVIPALDVIDIAEKLDLKPVMDKLIKLNPIKFGLFESFKGFQKAAELTHKIIEIKGANKVDPLIKEYAKKLTDMTTSNYNDPLEHFKLLAGLDYKTTDKKVDYKRNPFFKKTP